MNRSSVRRICVYFQLYIIACRKLAASTTQLNAEVSNLTVFRYVLAQRVQLVIAQLSCLPLHSVVLSTRRRSCTRLYITKSIHRVVVRYCDSLNTPPNNYTHNVYTLISNINVRFATILTSQLAAQDVCVTTVKCTCEMQAFRLSRVTCHSSDGRYE